MVRSIPEVWRDGDTGRIAGTAAADVVFSSPVADYRGRDPACHLLRLVPRTMDGIATTGRWTGPDGTVTTFSARVGDEPLHGIVHERRNADGLLEHVTLYLRPLHALRAAIARIRVLLDEHPLP